MFFQLVSHFFFALADRIFYYPRLLLGYRMGTLFNYFLLVLTYLQVRSLCTKIIDFDNIREKKSIILKIINSDVIAFLSITLFYILADLGTYMVDLTAIPLLLYLLQIVIEGDVYEKKGQHLFIALLFGLVFALKFTNIIFIGPILLIYIINNRKNISIFLFVLCFLLAILPAAPYLIYAYTSTGNPVFWTFNSVFKSDYYIDENFKDTRWGPTTLIEALFWPIHLIINPKEHVSEISCLPQCYLLLGIMGGFYLIIKKLRKKIVFDKDLKIIYYFIITYVLWLKSTGYPRYAILCEILAVLVIAKTLINVSISENKKRVFQILSCFTIIVLTLQASVNIINAALNKYNWTMERDIPESIKNGSYQMNLEKCFKDKTCIGTDEQRKKIDIFYSTQVLHNMMKQLKPDAPIINARYIYYDLDKVSVQKKENDFIQIYSDKIKDLAETNRIFDIILATQIGEACKNADMIGAYIKNVEYIPSYYVYDRVPLLIEYGFDKEIKNTYTNLSETNIVDVNCDINNKVKITGIGFLDPYVVWDSTPEHVIMYVETNSGEKSIVWEKDFEQYQIYLLDEEIDLSKYSGKVRVYIEDTRKANVAHVINMEIVAEK